MAPKDTVTTRVQRFREAAAAADNIGDLALAVDQHLAKARADLLVMAAHARRLADKLNRDADADEVKP